MLVVTEDVIVIVIRLGLLRGLRLRFGFVDLLLGFGAGGARLGLVALQRCHLLLQAGDLRVLLLGGLQFGGCRLGRCGSGLDVDVGEDGLVGRRTGLEVAHEPNVPQGDIDFVGRVARQDVAAADLEALGLRFDPHTDTRATPDDQDGYHAALEGRRVVGVLATLPGVLAVGTSVWAHRARVVGLGGQHEDVGGKQQGLGTKLQGSLLSARLAGCFWL